MTELNVMTRIATVVTIVLAMGLGVSVFLGLPVIVSVSLGILLLILGIVSGWTIYETLTMSPTERQTQLEEKMTRKALKTDFITDRQVNQIWKTAEVVTLTAIREESALKAREKELEYFKRAEQAKEQREKKDQEMTGQQGGQTGHS